MNEHAVGHKDKKLRALSSSTRKDQVESRQVKKFTISCYIV